MGEALAQIIIMYLGYVVLCIVTYNMLKRFIDRRVAIAILALLMLSPMLLYVPIEFKTMMYGDQFNHISMETGFNLPVIYYKVFGINDAEAKLFVVEGESGVHEVGNFYWFTKKEGQWVYAKKWKTIWTNLGGSASEFTVPPYF